VVASSAVNQTPHVHADAEGHEQIEVNAVRKAHPAFFKALRLGRDPTLTFAFFAFYLCPAEGPGLSRSAGLACSFAPEPVSEGGAQTSLMRFLSWTSSSGW
jgi:hypothetical protein